MKTKQFSFKVESFRNVETPFTKNGYRDYYCVVAIKNLPNLQDWRKINVRDPKLTGSVPKAIKESFYDNPELFLFMNRGIVIAADSVRFDNKTLEVTISLSDPNLHGLLDGGHTYNIITEEATESNLQQYVKVEILEGFLSEDIAQVVDARNTSNQVKDESLMNLSGEFDDLKKALKGTTYIDKIAFKEFELDENDNPKPIDIREVIAILTAFDADNFSDKVHPINTYRSKVACLKHFKNNTKSYKKIYPLAKEILALYDSIQEKLPNLYNKARGQSGDVGGGKFGRLTGVTVYDKSFTNLYFIDKKSKYSVPAGFIYPILGAFRAFLEEKNNKYHWGENIDPLNLLEGDLGLKLADTLGTFALEAQNPSKTGKQPLVWQACYQQAQIAYLLS
jgi:hypothetical protein